MYKTFGNTKSVFVNQDEGMFIAFPITLDSTALTLETESRNGRTYVKAGSVVKEGSSVRGILAEEYDITDGPVAGRIVLEGYAWASRLTANALAAVSSLPKIIVMPYKAVTVELKSTDATAHKLVISALAGAKFASTFSGSDITISGGDQVTFTYSVNTAGDELTITASAAGEVNITAIALTGFVGAASGSVLNGLPIKETI